MTALEMTLLCAQAVGYQSIRVGSERGPNKKPFDTVWVAKDAKADHSIYNPVSGLLSDLG